MRKLRFLFTLLVVNMFAVQGAWASVAPTIPERKTLESGNTYYLYNVGSDRFLTCNDNSYSYSEVYAYTDKGSALKISAVNGSEYTIQFTKNNQYVANVGNGFLQLYGTYDPSTYGRFTFTEIEGGYLIQNVYNGVETEFVGFNDIDYNKVYHNLTSGNVVWQLMDAEEAARFIAKRNLYRALVSANGYSIGEWETVYDDDGSTNYALQDAADMLKDAVRATNTIGKPEWSDYNILFYAENLYDNWYIDDYYKRIEGQAITNGSRILKATVDVDDDATLVFNYCRYWYDYGMLEVYLDEVLQFTVNKEESYNNQRYFVELSSGKHHITWKFINDNLDNYGECRLSGIGIEKTPTIIVSLLEPGSLGTEVLAKTDHIKNVRKLIVRGEMNDDDWTQILNMNSIFSIDLTDAIVTEIPESQLSYYHHSDSYSFLHSVKLPTTLKTIGNDAFNGTCLDEITFPEGLQTIGYNAFQSTRIKEAILPTSLTTLGVDRYNSSYAFSYNESLTTVSIPASVVTIPRGMFNGCYNLQPFQIPEGITTIGEYAFYDCRIFNSSIPTTVTSIDGGAFENSGITSVEISENTTIGDYAFKSCRNLTSIVLPTTYYDDVYEMLSQCGSLSDVTFKSPTMVLANSDIFNNTNRSNINLHVPNYLVNTYKMNSYWYNCNVIGFSTADVSGWNLCQPLKMSTGQRFEGTPNVKLMGAGTWEIKGDDAMTLNNLETDFYNDYYGFKESMTTQILSTCDNITINGNYTHYYYTKANTWYFVTLPFDTKVGDISSSASFAVRYYDGANRAVNGTGGNWKNYAKDDVIPAGTGFIFQTSQDVWTGFKAQDNVSKQRVFSNEIITTNLQVNASEQKEHKGWNLVGNPWMSYYNIHKMNFTAPITTWNPDYGTYTAYSIFDDDYAIKPNEAFFVQCPGDEMTTIEFPVDGRQLTSVIESQNAARAMTASERKLIDVELTDGELTDKTRFVMNPQASMDYEVSCDASKFMSMDANVPQIWTVEQGVQMAINERPLENGTVQIGFKVAQGGQYTISAPRNGFKNIVLVDNETGMESDLSNVDSYTFSTDAGINESRFMLRVGSTIVNEIKTLNAEQSTINEYYNLNGQRVSQPQKGLYIINGKKAIVK